MIISNETNDVIYDNNWSLSAEGAVHLKYDIRDSNVTTADFTEIVAELPEDFDSGMYSYSGGEFSLTDLGLSLAKEAAKKSVSELKYSKIMGGVSYLGEVFETNPNEISSIHSLSERYRSSRQGWSTQSDWETNNLGYWRTADNKNFVMSLEQFHGLSDLLTTKIISISLESHRLKGSLTSPGAIDTCTSREEIDQLLTGYITNFSMLDT